jgi:hypothetical protein
MEILMRGADTRRRDRAFALTLAGMLLLSTEVPATAAPVAEHEPPMSATAEIRMAGAARFLSVNLAGKVKNGMFTARH